MRGPSHRGGPSEVFVVAVLILFTAMGGAVALGGGLINLFAPVSTGSGQGPADVGCRTGAGLVAHKRGEHSAEDSGEGEAP